MLISKLKIHLNMLHPNGQSYSRDSGQIVLLYVPG